MRKLVSAIVLVLGTLCSQAWAAQPTIVQEIVGNITGIGVSSATATGAAIGTGHAVVGMLIYSSTPATLTNIQVGGTNAVIDDTIDSTYVSSSNRHFRTFHLFNVTGNPTTVTANFGTAANYAQITWQEVYPLASVDVHSAREIVNSSTAQNGISTAAVTTAQPDYLYGVVVQEPGTGTASFPVPGTGYAAGIHTNSLTTDWVMQTEHVMQNTASSNTQALFTYAPAPDVWFVALTAFKLAPYPVGMTGTCASPITIPNTTNAPTALCGYTVTTSDNSTYSGASTVNPGLTFALSSSTTNGNLLANKQFTSADNGLVTAHLTFTENGVTLPVDVPITVTAVSIPGTPLAMGWKGVDPSGQVIFTEPTSAKTVNQLLLRNSALSGSAAILHVYRAPPGVACTLANAANLTSLHNGDFNLFGGLNDDQDIAVINGSLSIADSVCVLARDGSTGAALSSSAIGSMQGTLTVTVN